MPGPGESSFDPSSMSWDDDEPEASFAGPQPVTVPRSDLGALGARAAPTSAVAPAGTTEGRRLGGIGLGLAVIGTAVLASSLWMALKSISISTDPLGNAPKWLSVALVALAVLVAALVIGVFAILTRRGRALGAVALVVGIALAPILSGFAATLGADDLQSRARQTLQGGAGVGLERAVKALGELGVPEAPLRSLLGQ